VKICGSGCGFSDFGDGATHQALEDVSLMRCLPNMTIIVPADAAETSKAVEASLKINGPVYLRINRVDVPIITDPDNSLEVGKPYVLKDGSDFVIFSNGIMLHKSLEAANILAGSGISVKVVNVPWIKPLNKEDVVNHAKGMKGVVIAEEHNKYGGLVSAVSEILAGEGSAKVKYVAVEDQFGTSAENYDLLLEKYGLTTEHIIKVIKELSC
jgi:transketolase